MQGGLTLKQERLVEAVLDPATQSIAEAGRKAGYKYRQGAHEAIVTSRDVQRAIAERKARKLDLVNRGAQLVSRSFEAIESVRTLEPAQALQVLVATKGLDLVALQEAATPEAATETHRDRARRIKRSYVERGIAIALRWPDRLPALMACIERRRSR